MNSQYNAGLVARYESAERLRNPHQVRAYKAWLSALGSVSALRVVDLGCGSGYSTRMLKQAGAKEVCGIDESEPMLSVARAVESTQQLNITYIHGDCTKPISSVEKGDLVSAVWLFHYAHNQEALLCFARTSFELLKKGGRLVAIAQTRGASLYRQGAQESGVWLDHPHGDGARQKVSLWDTQGREICSFLVYVWGKETYEHLFRSVGFVDISIEPLSQEDSCSLLVAHKPI